MSNGPDKLTIVDLEDLGDGEVEALARDEDGYEYRARASRKEIEALAPAKRRARLVELVVEQNHLPRQVGPAKLGSLLGP